MTSNAFMPPTSVQISKLDMKGLHGWFLGLRSPHFPRHTLRHFSMIKNNQTKACQNFIILHIGFLLGIQNSCLICDNFHEVTKDFAPRCDISSTWSSARTRVERRLWRLIVSKTVLEANKFFPPQKIEQIQPHWQNGLFPVSVSCDQQKNNLTWRFQHLPFRCATKMADVDRCCGATVFLMIFQATSTHDLPIHSGHDFPFCWCKIPTSSGKVAFESWENCIKFGEFWKVTKLWLNSRIVIHVILFGCGPLPCNSGRCIGRPYWKCRNPGGGGHHSAILMLNLFPKFFDWAILNITLKREF